MGIRPRVIAGLLEAFADPMREADVHSMARGRTRRVAGRLMRVAAGNADSAVYGTVMVGVLFAAEDSHHGNYPATIGAAMLVLTLYGLTSIYSHMLGFRLRTRGRLDKTLLRRSSAHELAMVEGALVPLLALIAAWVSGATLSTGVTVAVWATAATIIALELAAAWLARLAPRDLCRQAGAGAVMGLGIIALKLLLH